MGFPLSHLLPGIFIEFSMLGLLFSGDLLENKSLFLFFYFLAFTAYLFAATRVKSNADHLPILLFAFLFRATLLFSYPSLTVDIYRYFWDGKLLAHGINPYLYLPYSDELNVFRDGYYGLLAYKGATTIYPPFAQLIFALSYSISPTLFTLKFASALFDTGAVLLLVKILELKKMDKSRMLLYAWNPLVIVEFASSGHADSIAIFFVLLSYYLHLQQKSLAGGAALALGVLSKLYPILLLPFFIKKDFKFLLGFMAAAASGYLLFLGAGWKVFGGLEVFIKHAKFNPGAFYLLESFMGFSNAKYVSLSAVALGYLFLLRRENTIRGCYLILTLYLLFSPMVHPWYVAWTLSLVPLLEAYAWVAFSGLAALSYALVVKTPHGIVWEENVFITLVQYLPLYIILLREEVLNKRFKT